MKNSDGKEIKPQVYWPENWESLSFEELVDLELKLKSGSDRRSAEEFIAFILEGPDTKTIPE